MKWKWLLILVFSVNLAYLSLEGSEICGPRGQAFSTHLWWCLIYAASWMQLFCMSTALKSLGDADSLKKDWLPLVVFIWGACHQCVDWRWMFCFQFGGRGLLSFLNLGALWVGMLPSIPLSVILYFFNFHPFLCHFSDLRREAVHPFILVSSPLLPSASSLYPHLHFFLSPSSQSLIQGAKHRLSWPLASRSIGPIVYSLHPDTKDIKLTDQRAGARARLINEALGREEEEELGGWMEERGQRGRRWEGGVDR